MSGSVKMLRSKQTFPLNELLCGCLKELWETGIFDEYSENHFLIKAIKRDDEYFKDVFIRRKLSSQYKIDFGFNFAINLNSRINFLCNYFGKEKIYKFLKDQFSAGKSNYSEDKFFEALAEIHILAFFLAFIQDGVSSAEYEPNLVENSKKNPEARIKYLSGATIDIEVKTPKFGERNILENYLSPATLLTDKGRKELIEFCKECNISVRMPQVNKIKDFINYAGAKFCEQENEQHYNILAINWSFTDMYEDPLFEPTLLLCNRNNGILVNDKMHEKLGINEGALEKISAFLLYTFPAEALLFSDVRYLFKYRCYKVIANPFSKFDATDAIHNLTHFAVKYPNELWNDLTTFFNLEQKDWSSELGKIRDIINENIM